MRIFLIGFMGSGKSTSGNELAGKLRMEFVDLDAEIERKQNRSITDLFLQGGEDEFRMHERQALFECETLDNAVVALGGGAPCTEENWNFIRRAGMSIYLKEDEEHLYSRLMAEKKKRPLIADLDEGELHEFISGKLAEREPFYNRADFIWERDKTSFDFLVNQIRNYIK